MGRNFEIEAEADIGELMEVGDPSTSGAERIPHPRDHFRAVFPRECDGPKQSHMLDMKLTGITRRNQTSEPSAD